MTRADLEPNARWGDSPATARASDAGSLAPIAMADWPPTEDGKGTNCEYL